MEIKWSCFNHNLKPGKNEVHIFKIRIKEYHHRFNPHYWESLTDEEFSKAHRFKQPVDNQRYLASRFALRNILQHFVASKPCDIRFLTTANKKPCLDGIEFNLSHSGEYILIAIGNLPLGIDIEQIKSNVDTRILIDQCFHKKEYSFVASSDHELIAFYGIWTRKESILKATGEGLINRLNELNSIPQTLHRDEQVYNLHSFMLDSDYACSICVQGAEHPVFHYWYL